MGSPVRPVAPTTPQPDPVQAYLAKYGKSAPVAAAPESTATVDPVTAYRQKYGTPPQNGSMADVVASGLSMGLAPKLGGLLSAGEDLVKNHSLSHAADTYNAAVAENQQNLAAERKRAPGASAAVEAASSVVPIAATTLVGGNPLVRRALQLPAELAPEAGGLASRLAQTARVGAGTGAIVSGATSTGSLADRAKSMAAGAAGGAALGAGGQALGELGGATWSALRAMTTPVATRAGATAEKQLATAFVNDGGIEAAMQRGASDDAIGAPSLVAHTGGRNINNLVWKSVNTPSSGGTQLAAALAPIKEQEGDVLSRGLGEVSGVGDATAYARKSQITRQQSISGHQLYGTALGNAPISDPEIAHTIAGTPKLLDTAKQSLKALETQGVATDADRAAVQGIQYLADNPEAPQVVRDRIASQPMSIQLLHTMKRGAGDLIDAGLAKDKAFTKLDADNLNSAVDNILARIDAQNPDYAAARMVWGNDARRLDAIDAGANAPNEVPEAITAKRAGLAPLGDEPRSGKLLPQHDPDYVLGAVDALRQKMAAKTPGSTVTNTVFGPQVAKDRLAAILGPDGGDAFDPYLDWGGRVEAAHNRAFGGSSTSGNENIKAEDATPDYGMGVRGLLSHRRALMAAAQRFTNLQRKGFQGAVSDQLGQWLAVPSGTPAAEAIYNRLQEVRDENSADALTAAALRAWRLRNAIGMGSGAVAGNR
jgi:hypothetical protein